MSVRNLFTFTVVVATTFFSLAARSVPLLPDLIATDSENGIIYTVAPNKTISILITEAQITAATGATEARFTDNGLHYDAATGDLYFTESESDSVLKRSASGVVSVVATKAQIEAATTPASASPEHLVLVGGFLYVTDQNAEALLKIDPSTGTTTVHTDLAAFKLAAGTTDDIDIESGIAVSADGSTIYVGNDDSPSDLVFEIDVATGAPSVLATTGTDLDVFLTLAPNGDVIVADDANSVDGVIYRITPAGTVSTFISTVQLQGVIGPIVDLEGGVAFDEFGNFYIAERETDSLYRWPVLDLFAGTIDPTAGVLWLSEATIAAALGVADVDYEGGITFGAVPEPQTFTLLLAGLLLLIVRRRARR